MNPRFPNGACMSSSAGKNGTCYAEDECTNKGGTGYGSCAGGYGVCCVCKSEFYFIFFMLFILYILSGMLPHINVSNIVFILETYQLLFLFCCNYVSSKVS